MKDFGFAIVFLFLVLVVPYFVSSVQERNKLADKILSDSSCYLVESKVYSVGSVFPSYHSVYRCDSVTYQIDFNLDDYRH